MIREIVLDTETTGLKALQGDRIVEIGCVELHNRLPTGTVYHVYVNPERSISDEVVAVHGLTEAFLSDKPVFAEVVGDFLDFIADAPLVIHNASFDMGFLNAELTRIGMTTLPMQRSIDTVMMARRMFPGAPASLDALCKRFGVDATERQLHGALLDARLLADVYLELCGGRQPGLDMAAETTAVLDAVIDTSRRVRREPRQYAVTDSESMEHEAFIGTIKQPLWRK